MLFGTPDMNKSIVDYHKNKFHRRGDILLKYINERTIIGKRKREKERRNRRGRRIGLVPTPIRLC